MRVRIATFNLENFDMPHGHGIPLEARVAVLRPQLLRLRADILCLQEVSAHVPHHGVHELQALERLLEETPYAGFERRTTRGRSGGPNDKHNLVVLSRLPIRAFEQHWHDLVAPPVITIATSPSPHDVRVVWDRPFLEVRVELPGGESLWVFDAHLRAPLAAPIEAQKLAATSWRTTEGWSEGYFLASIKRSGQALELRRRIDAVFDDDLRANVLVAGDLNADASSSAVRILRADVEDTGNPDLAPRALEALEERVPTEKRYSVLHHGRGQMLDHLLASQSLARRHVATDILNADLDDEFFTPHPVGSLHAPVVVELEV
ncbi:hypothetical protein AKJ09_07236 [Labilithrix luteola]|uniref:Endonuclease/exonuclease/phosphatase domain-containing protein n=1 Tax=Labilithrix luteola TaxID=1391654 RepID=A0A0K1Q4B0_9BACT|nr:endonuclease/exonuclease/phosphatase family protein [Labilithrix luteola]AKV00573.1 hypothetical protein AKJ09_07236 [Labilithrix luteola]